MKKILCFIALTIPLYACVDNSESPPEREEATPISLSPLWETGGLRVPESVLYHEDGEETFLFVAEIEGRGELADGEGGIAKLSLDGEIIDQDWVRGLNAPKGMGVHQGKLYVADITEVIVIDIASAAIEGKITVPNSLFLNDIAVDDAGVVYVSDTRTGTVHRIENGSPALYMRDVPGANGLTFVDSELYVGAGPALWKVGADKQLISVADGFEEGVDGVEMIRPGEFIVSCWPGLIYHVTADGAVQKLLDTREKDINTADIGWNDADGILYVPTFFTNSVIAYRL